MRKNIEHYKKVKQAELELNRRINETSRQSFQESQANSVNFFGDIFTFLLFGIFYLFSVFCKVYVVIVASFTIFTGVKLAFSGESFGLGSFLPFHIGNLSASYLFLASGLLAASVCSHRHSGTGYLLGIAHLLAGIAGLFGVTFGFAIVLPGFWGSGISGLITLWIGFSMVVVILDSWKK